MADVIAAIEAAVFALCPPVVRVVNTGDPRKAYVYAPQGERRIVFLHPEAAAQIGVEDGDDLPEPHDSGSTDG